MKLKKYFWSLVVVVVATLAPRPAPALPLEIVFHLLPRYVEAALAFQGNPVAEPWSLVGRVQDEAGEPLVGARLRLREPGADDILERTTGAGGEFSFGGLRAGRELELRAEHEGFQVTSLLVKPQDTAEIVLVLAAASRIAGRVVAEGEGVAGALVLVRSGDRTRASTQCDEEGRFRVNGVKPGLLELQAVAAGLMGEPLVFELVAGETAEELEITLSAGAVVEGTVSSAQGEPLAGVVVERVVSDRDLVSRLAASQARTDEDGVYRLTGLPTGPVRLRARRADLIGSEREIELTADSTGLDWQLESGIKVAGRILTSEGRPVAGAAMAAFDADGRAVVEGIVSDRNGNFELEGLPAGSVRVVGEPANEARTEKVFTLAAGAETPAIVLVCPPAASLKGRLIGASAEVLAEAQIWASGPQGERRPGEVSAGGFYRIPALAPGTWRVTTRLPGWPREVSRETRLEPGEAATLDLDLAVSGFRLRGQVVKEGAPLAGVLVAANSSGTAGSGAVTDGQGLFEIAALPAGTYQITVLGSGTSLSRAIELRGDLQLDFDLTPTNKKSPNENTVEEIR